MIYLGDDKIGRLYLGSTEIGKAYLGDTLVFQKGSGPTPPAPVFYDRLEFDGTAYIQTDITLPENSSICVIVGGETSHTAQSVFDAQGGGGRISVIYGGATNSTHRQLVPYYDATTYLLTDVVLDWTYPFYSLFLTPERIGFGNVSRTFTKGGTHPTGGLLLGYHSGGTSPFTGYMKEVRIFDSSAQGCTTFADFSNYTPVITLRPCTVNGVAGMWYVERGRFYGNTAGSGTLYAGNLPSAYTPLTYVESGLGNTAYINTGVTTSDNIGFEIDAVSFDQIGEADYGCLFGGRYNSNSSDFQLSTYTAQGSGFSGTIRRGAATQNYNAHLVYNTRFQAGLNGTTYTINSTDYSGYSASIASSRQRNIYLFALNNNNTAAQHGHCRIYSFKLTNNGTVVLNYTPCKRNLDDVVGFYDLAKEVFVPPTSGTLVGVI